VCLYACRNENSLRFATVVSLPFCGGNIVLCRVRTLSVFVLTCIYSSTPHHTCSTSLKVHLYTYDLFAEKIGMKLTWGCLFFYPFFYCIGVHTLVSAPSSSAPSHDITTVQSAGICALYAFGWFLTRGANLQKYFYKTQPGRKHVFFGLIEQRCVPGTHLLVSGFWGLAQHLNYLGEILQALALALPGCFVGHSYAERAIGFLYPLYYIVLFIPRQIDDDAICAEKYKANWVKYTTAVPARIMPGVW